MEEGISGDKNGGSKESEVGEIKKQGIGSYLIRLEYGNCRLGGNREPRRKAIQGLIVWLRNLDLYSAGIH